MPNCKLYPERCKAALDYSREENKFKVERINDATKQRQLIDQTYKNRVDSKEWKNVYPLNNHDFDYNEYVLNKYTPYKLGITNEPSMKGLIDGTLNLSNYVDVMLEDPTPNSNTKAGVDDINNSNPMIYKHFKGIKDKYSQMPLPYPEFKKDYPESKYPTRGKASSSYFIKTGTCKSKIDNAKVCQEKGFTWMANKLDLSKNTTQFFKTISRSKTKQPKKNPDGICYKPKFIYINNIPKGNQNLQGMAPALINDVMNISPDKLFPILSGQQVDGGGVIPCKEGFVDYRNNMFYNLNIHLSIMLLFILMLIKLLFYRT